MAVLEISHLNEKLAVYKQSEFDHEQYRLACEDRLVKLQEKLFGRGTESLDKELRPRRVKKDEVLSHGNSFNSNPEHKMPKTAQDRDLNSENFLYPMTPTQLKEEAMMRGLKNAKPKDWKELGGLFDESTEITIVERTYKKRVHKRKKYIYLPSVGTDKEIIVTAPGPEKLAPGCTYSIDFAITSTCDKFQYHGTSLYRPGL